MEKQRVFRIFISASKKDLEYERPALIENILLQNCMPITMEYFINSNNITTIKACVDSIDISDAVILILKERYGTKIEYTEIQRTFPEGCPLKGKKCNCEDNNCKLSYTHFEYLYAKLKNKVLYVISSNTNETIEDENMTAFIHDAQSQGCYNVYVDNISFNAISAAIISRIVQACNEADSLGLVPANLLTEKSSLQQRIDFLENNFYNGFRPKKILWVA